MLQFNSITPTETKKEKIVFVNAYHNKECILQKCKREFAADDNEAKIMKENMSNKC